MTENARFLFSVHSVHTYIWMYGTARRHIPRLAIGGDKSQSKPTYKCNQWHHISTWRLITFF